MRQRKQRELKLAIDSSTFFILNPVKIKRENIYGYKETHVVDKYNRECVAAYVNDDNSELLPMGGLKSMYFDTHDEFVDLSFNRTLDPNVFSSSFDVTNYIRNTNELSLLTSEISSAYKLVGIDIERFAETVGNKIYAFDFRYTTGKKSETAYILCEEKSVFMLVGSSAYYSPVEFENKTVFDEAGSAPVQEDDIDFAMF